MRCSRVPPDCHLLRVEGFEIQTLDTLTPFQVINGDGPCTTPPPGLHVGRSFSAGLEVMGGNTSDRATLRGFLDKIEKTYGKAKRMWVMDRGIPSEEILRGIRDPASVFAGLRIADHGPGAVIDLGLFSGCGNDHGSRLRGLVSAKLAHEAFDGLIAAVEPALGHQVLPDRHGIATLAQAEFDRITKRFAQTDGRNGLGGFLF